MATSAPPRVVHALPGRARIHVPAWEADDAAGLEARLTRVEGVRRVQASARTRNVLVEYDHRRLDEAAVLRRVRGALRPRRAHADPRPTSTARRARGGLLVTRGSAARARIVVHGLDRDPEMGRRLVERLGARPEVRRVVPSPLTGRVLVEFAEEAADLGGVLDDIGQIEWPGDDEHELPAHPLDPASIIEGAARVAGAALGLGLLLARRARGNDEPPVRRPGPGEIAGVVALLEGIPAVAHALEDRLGHQRKELTFAAVGITATSASGGLLGLAFAGASGLRVLTEALARRRAWRDYEARLGEEAPAHPGAVLTLEAGRRVPLGGRVVDGDGVGQASDGAPHALIAGARADAGMRVHGGPVTIELTGDAAVPAPSEQAPPPQPRGTLYERYLALIPRAASVAALAVAGATRSLARGLTTLLVLSPRGALAGAEHADRAAAARALRAGAVIAGSRAERPVRGLDLLVLDGARTLLDGWELRDAVAEPGGDADELLALAGAVAIAAGSPWDGAVPGPARVVAVDGAFDGTTASADVAGERWTVGPGDAAALRREPGDHVLVVRRERDGHVAGELALRPRLAGGAGALVDAARARGVRLELVSPQGTDAARAIAARAGVPLTVGDAAEHVAAMRAEGLTVATVGDGAGSGPAFEAADLAIGLSSGQSGRFLARADLLAPRLETVAAVVDAGARRDLAVRDSAALAILGNVLGVIWELRFAPRFSAGTRPVLLAGLTAMADATLRLGGGRRARTVVERLTDPVPERWGREPVAAVLERLHTSLDGLSADEAERRRTPPVAVAGRQAFLSAVAAQLASPLVAFLAGGAALSLGIGAAGDAAMIGAVVVANALVGAWQEREAGEAARALEEMSARTARVLRDGREEEVPATHVVPGDVVLLASGDRVPADARVVEAWALEVDEAALTGESVPVDKVADNGTDAARVVLEGSDVTTGTGRAVVVAVGPGTRMGAIAAALGEDARGPSPLDQRLARIMWSAMPLIALGGALVAGSGIAFGRPAVEQLALGASIAIAAVPEGLPLLAGVAEAGVARRLARRRALVTRLAAVEALGRVDVACADKTGTLTAGRLALRRVADAVGREAEPPDLPPDLREVLHTAALASPAPGASDAEVHPTDVAVIEGARAAGVPVDARERGAELPFDPVRAFHATVVGDRLCLKGAAEVLAPRCVRVRTPDGDVPLDDAGREALLRRAAALAGEGLRVLLVAEGPADTPLDDPRDLTAVGFVGIGDVVRPTSAEAVARCRAAGVRVVMLTGDHPATARAVAREVGLPSDEEHMLTGPEVAALDDDALRERLELATVIARVTPLDKLRIVEALRLGGHVVAMTGDGVNDAPALRLADVGVAMGRHGTDVARHAADVVLADDDFATLAEALVEGRGFWRNMRRALGLLLGGNAGEVGTVVATALLGLGSPLTTRQVLTVNLVTDVLPAMTVAMKAPETRDLAALAREGSTGLDAPLRAEIVRRAVATSVPSVAGCALAAARGRRQDVGPVAFMSIVGTQLAQALGIGWSEGRPDPAIVAAVVGSVALLGLAAWVPVTRRFLELDGLTPGALLLAAGASAAAPLVARAVPGGR